MGSPRPDRRGVSLPGGRDGTRGASGPPRGLARASRPRRPGSPPVSRPWPSPARDDPEGSQEQVLIEDPGAEHTAGRVVDEGDARRAEEQRIDGVEVAVLAEQVVEETAVIARRRR